MSSEWVVDVTEDAFEADVLTRSHELPVVVDFWAEWCGPCRVLGPTLEKLAAEGAGSFLLAKVDTDRAQMLAQAFSIRSIPTVIAFKAGEPVSQFSGALPEDAVREFLGRLSPSESDVAVEQADALGAEDPEKAAALYQKVLEENPSHDGAKVGLSEVWMAAGRKEDARGLVEQLLPPVGPYAERIEHLRSELALEELKPELSEDELRARLESDPDNGELWLSLGQLLAAEKRYPEALDALFKSAQADRTLANGRAKELMVDIFHVIGVRSEMSDDYRTKLARLLY